MKDEIKVLDQLELFYCGRRIVAPPVEKEVIQVQGFFSCVCRERGKIVWGTHREGFNIWTLTGREHLAQLQSYKVIDTREPARNDRLLYIGFGIGTQPEVSSVSRLVDPIPYNGAEDFLAQLALPSYPLAPTRTTARYTRSFVETELSVTAPVTLTEAGIFTDGDPLNNFTPPRTDLSWATTKEDAPNGYKTFEPLRKSQNFVLEASWEVRF